MYMLLLGMVYNNRQYEFKNITCPKHFLLLLLT